MDSLQKRTCPLEKLLSDEELAKLTDEELRSYAQTVEYWRTLWWVQKYRHWHQEIRCTESNIRIYIYYRKDKFEDLSSIEISCDSQRVDKSDFGSLPIFPSFSNIKFTYKYFWKVFEGSYLKIQPTCICFSKHNIFVTTRDTKNSKLGFCRGRLGLSFHEKFWSTLEAYYFKRFISEEFLLFFQFWAFPEVNFGRMTTRMVSN